LSTKRARPVPPEFEAEFVQHGHDHCKRLFGKRAAQRYFTALGAERLRAARDAHLRAVKQSPEPQNRCHRAGAPARVMGFGGLAA
jgi:hypothetical protein